MVDSEVQVNNILNLLIPKYKFKTIDELEEYYIKQISIIVQSNDDNKLDDTVISDYLQNSFNLVLQHYSYSSSIELYNVIKSHYTQIYKHIEVSQFNTNINILLLDNCINNLKSFDRIKLDKKLNQIKYNLNCFTIDPYMFKAKSLYQSAKSRAKDKNLDFNLTVEWIYNKLILGCCEVTNIQFKLKEYEPDTITSSVYPNSPSLDRIDNNKGYTTNNVQVVCDQFNKFKSQYTMEETYYMAKQFIQQYENTK